AELVASLRKAKPDPKVDAFAEEVHAFEGGAKAYDDTLTSIVRAAVASKKKTELRDIDAKLAAAEERERRARDVAIVRYEHFLATWHGENAAEVEEAKTRLAALYDAAGRHEDATRLRER
ncbi:MAG TPA: hypothetical protein VIF62_26380, partial [Labilithrix sp.]